MTTTGISKILLQVEIEPFVVGISEIIECDVDRTISLSENEK